jgi:hypothetical protein
MPDDVNLGRFMEQCAQAKLCNKAGDRKFNLEISDTVDRQFTWNLLFVGELMRHITNIRTNHSKTSRDTLLALILLDPYLTLQS